MTTRLRSSLLLLAFAPLALHAQVLAGDPTGLTYTDVDILLAPTLGPFPTTDSDTASIDLDGDGSHELLFNSDAYHVFDGDGTNNGCIMLHAGVEVAVDAPGGYVVKRLNASDPVDASLDWRPYEAGGGNWTIMAGMYTNILWQWVVQGGEQWLVNGSVPTQGYLAVRVVEPTDTLYGWVSLTSYVGQDSAWLQINDFAIETLTTGITDAQETEELSARLMLDGMLLLQGQLNAVAITLHDTGGRVVRQLAGPSPFVMDIAGEARGIYVLSIVERTRTRTFKLAW